MSFSFADQEHAPHPTAWNQTPGLCWPMTVSKSTGLQRLSSPQAVHDGQSTVRLSSVALLRRVVARTRLKRASAQALSEPIFAAPARMRGTSVAPPQILTPPSALPGSDFAQPLRWSTSPSAAVAVDELSAGGVRSTGVFDASMRNEPVHCHGSATGSAYSDPSASAAQWTIPDCPDWSLTRRAQRRRRRRLRRVGAA